MAKASARVSIARFLRLASTWLSMSSESPVALQNSRRVRKRVAYLIATGKLGEQVTDKFYKVESFGRTLYHLLGIDPATVMQTPSNRPIKLIAEDAPLVKETLA